jgi:hypothetical protein
MSSSKPPAPVLSPPGSSSVFSPPQFGGRHAASLHDNSNGYGGFSSSTSSRPNKSPKSSKRGFLENPLLKASNHMGAPSFGGDVGPAITAAPPAFPMAPTFSHHQQNYDDHHHRPVARSPLTDLGMNNFVGQQIRSKPQMTPQPFVSPKPTLKKPLIETPGPPPKASLSLMGGMILPMEVSENGLQQSRFLGSLSLP